MCSSDLPFSALLHSTPAGTTVVMEAARARRLMSHDGRFSSRALFPFDAPRKAEFYEIRIAPRGVEHADPHWVFYGSAIFLVLGILTVTGGRKLIGA